MIARKARSCGRSGHHDIRVPVAQGALQQPFGEHHMTELALIVAKAENNVIGRDNRLPWRLPGELQYFRRVTMGKPVIMGRRTWESLRGPLPGRTNIVVTRQPAYEAPGAVVVHSLPEALARARTEPADEIMLIGGGELFAEGLPAVTRMYITEVHAEVEGDAFFPEVDMRGWREVSRERVAPGEGAPDYSLVVYERT